MNKYIKLLALSLLMVVGRGVASAETVDIVVGEYIPTTNAETTGDIKNNDNDGLGSIYKDATATFTLNNSKALDGVYLAFMTANNNESNPTVKVELSGDNYSKTQTYDIPNTGNWYFTQGTKRLMDLGSLPAGEIKLKFSFDNESSYVGNLGNIAFYTQDSYMQQPTNYINLNKGSYSNTKCPIERKESQGGYKIGYLDNGAWNVFDFYLAEDGDYSLCMAMAYSSGGTMNVKITDQVTGVEEVNQDIVVTSDLAKGYGNEVEMLLNKKLTKGVKTMKLSFSTSGDWFMDYENLRLTKADYILNVSDAKAATLVLPYAATIPAGVKAYKLTAVNGSKVTCEEVTGTLPANTPVLVNAEQGEYTFEVAEAAEESEAPQAGLLVGVWEETEVPVGAYVLQNQNGNVAFYKVTEGSGIKVKANQAYLNVNEVSSVSCFSIDFGGATTGVAGVEAVENAKDEPVYNLQGMRVSKNNLPKVYIKGGKKFVNK